MNTRTQLIDGLDLAREWADRWAPHVEIRQCGNIPHPQLLLCYLPSDLNYAIDMEDVTKDTVLAGIHWIQGREEFKAA